MKNLTKIFGSIVSIFFTNEGGISISEINRIQAENKQQNDGFWGKVSDAVSGVFKKTISFLGAGDSTPRTFPGATISIDEIKQYVGVAERNAQTSNLMQALKLHKRLQTELARMDLQLQVVDILPIAPTAPARPKTGTTIGTEKFMEIDNIDEMINSLDSGVLAKFDLSFWTKANELNSRAATIGKLLSEQGSFFRELVKALPKGSEQPTQNGVIVTQYERSYSESELGSFVQLRVKLQAEYNDLQKQLNGCRKQIKDAIREFALQEERQYQTALGTYNVEAKKHALEVERIRSSAETLRQEALRELAALKVRTK